MAHGDWVNAFYDGHRPNDLFERSLLEQSAKDGRTNEYATTAIAQAMLERRTEHRN